MATKKTAKKATKTVVVKALPFNKANAKLFAENIYSDVRGRVSFLKLCEGDLSNGKDGGRTLHCALGEAYFTFVSTDVKHFVEKMQRKHGHDVKYNYDDAVVVEGYYQPKYSNEDSSECTHTGTLAVVDALVDVAVLKSNKQEAKEDLARALLDTMQSNDDTCGADEAEEMTRAMKVAEVWRDEVLPLLK